ncbi:unnamed protein product, partial [Urochloa humidicola]
HFRWTDYAFHFAFSRSCRRGGRPAADCVGGQGGGGRAAVPEEDDAAAWCGEEEASGRGRSSSAGREEAAAAEAGISMGSGTQRGSCRRGRERRELGAACPRSGREGR